MKKILFIFAVIIAIAISYFSANAYRTSYNQNFKVDGDLEVTEDIIRDNERGVINLSTASTTLLASIDTYYQINGDFSDGLNNDFTLASDGTLTYIGEGGEFLLNGVSDLAVDKACETTYALYLNGALVTGAVTPHTFLASSKVSNISITGIVQLSTNDYMNVYAKSDTINTTIDVGKLTVTFWGE